MIAPTKNKKGIIKITELMMYPGKIKTFPMDLPFKGISSVLII